MLTVKSHHKVAWAQNPGEDTHDGFLLEDSAGNVWSNQYPRASYGQLSDRPDWLFTRYFPPGFDYGSLSHLQMSSYEDVRIVLERVDAGAKSLETGVGMLGAMRGQLLKEHLEWLISTVEKETGATIQMNVPDPHLGCDYAEVSWK